MTIVYIWLATHVASIVAYSFMLIDGKRKLRFSPNEEYFKIFFFGLIPIVSYVVMAITFIIYKDKEEHPIYKRVEKAANTLLICEGCKLSSRKHQQISSYYNGDNDNYYSGKSNKNDYDFYYSGEERSEYIEFYSEVSNCPHCKKKTDMKIAEEALQDSSISFAPKVSSVEAFNLFDRYSKVDKTELRRDFLSKADDSFNFAIEQEKLFNKIQQENFQQDFEKLKSI